MYRILLHLVLTAEAMYLLLACILESHTPGKFGGIMHTTAIVMPAVVTYLLPTYVAASRNAPRLSSIFLLNLIPGWTSMGWIAALVWACVDIKKSSPLVIVQHIYCKTPPPPPIDQP